MPRKSNAAPIPHEPSSLAEIQAARPPRRHSFTPGYHPHSCRDQLRGAWLGRIAGCLAGRPADGWTRAKIADFAALTGNADTGGYLLAGDLPFPLLRRFGLDPDAFRPDRLGGVAPMAEETDYTVLALKLAESKGFGFTSRDVLDSWLAWLPALDTSAAQRAAYRNGCNGLLPPETATADNPFQEWNGGQMRGDFWGYVCHGDPEAAAAMAFRDVSVSHRGNGIYGGMFVAAVLSAAASRGDIRIAVEAGLDELPAGCRLREEAVQVLGWVDEGRSGEEITGLIHSRYDEAREDLRRHAVPNAMIVVMALLCGGYDVGRAIRLAVRAGFSPATNAATAGSIMGILTGASHIDPAWTDCFHRGLASGVRGYELTAVDRLAEKTIECLGLLHHSGQLPR